MKKPVYIQTIASTYIGDVEIESKEDFQEAAYDLWESKQFDSPGLCHQCAHEMDLGEWDIDLTEME